MTRFGSLGRNCRRITSGDWCFGRVVVDGQTASPFQVMNATSIFSLTGNPAMTLRFGTGRTGLPIGVQIVSSWYAESTMFNAASRLQEVSPIRNSQPAL